MDSQEHFRRAEKYSKALRVAIITILLITCIAQFILILLFFKIDADNHKIGAENQQIINSNIDGYFKCLVDQGYANNGQKPTEAQANAELDHCAKTTTESLKGH